ncbi:MAG TPA: queuosine biosynthesis protein [Micromonosporaceae bacterium]|nr:queuosine biosynthesis protein [Micromonosporaceae bacterium]HCU50110.1 queuosine biosynthesis protein [Micromonosporaceae bacterium]
MTATTFDFTLSPDLEAHEPPEARGLARDQVRMLVGGPDGVAHHHFPELPHLLEPGDVLVVNNSATMPAAVSTVDGQLAVHFSTQLPDGSWVIEPRHYQGTPGERLRLPGGVSAVLKEVYSERLWIADIDVASIPGYLMKYGRPIRYPYVARDWPLSTYHSVFATELGSAEMPSASRPFTEHMVTRLASRGIVIAPITLHTGVASPEAHEKPYPERYSVPANTARLANEAKAAGQRIIAVGTTAVRALETAARPDGMVQASHGWTDLLVTPESGVLVTDGLLTGFHEPRASHLLMLEAIAGSELLSRCYSAAIAEGYLWHEFGDLNLLLAR